MLDSGVGSMRVESNKGRVTIPPRLRPRPRYYTGDEDGSVCWVGSSVRWSPGKLANLRVEQFFAANGVKKETHAPTLLALMGGKAYGLLKSLTAPEKPSSLSYDQVVKTLADHLAPKPPVIAERFRVHQRSQGPDETISAYVAGLRKLTHITLWVRHISWWSPTISSRLRHTFQSHTKASPIRRQTHLQESPRASTGNGNSG